VKFFHSIAKSPLLKPVFPDYTGKCRRRKERGRGKRTCVKEVVKRKIKDKRNTILAIKNRELAKVRSTHQQLPDISISNLNLILY